MDSLVCINQQPIVIREFENQRVITFKDIDAVHNRPEGTARKAFNRNKKRFIPGVDCFVLDTDEAKQRFNITAPNGLALITESGYLMISKVFDDDLSWEVQRQLVNTYFKAKGKVLPPQPKQLPQPRPKYFNGEPVITIRDLAEATGIDASVIRYHLKNCRAGIHYHVLTGSELADFKAENDEASSMNHLTVITKKGFVRLAKLIGRMPNKMECFQVEKHKEALPEAKHISDKADRLINEVHCCFDAAGVIMAIMRHHPSDIDAFRKVIEYVITSALVKALEI